MKSSELMIGDWVRMRRIDVENATYYTSKVLCLAKDGFLEYEPIPLTEDIIGNIIPFERCWDSTRDNPKGSVTEWRLDTQKAIVFIRDFRCGDGMYLVEIDVFGMGNLDVRLMLRYVHEVQHALRLCGLDEVADNFKIE